MSEMVRLSKNGNPLSHYVRTNTNKFYYVDSCLTFEGKYETLVLKCGSNGKVPQKSWQSPVFEIRYADKKEMEKHHWELVEDLEVYLGKGVSS